MPTQQSEYLATAVLNDGGIVTYRMLSRALKVHCNAAKEMLYDFYTSQNTRKQASVHATYLLAGIAKEDQHNGMPLHDEDSFMQDAGFMSSNGETPVPPERANVPVQSVTLVAEEHLEDVKALYAEITSISVYSLDPGPLPNIQLISDCNRKIAADYSHDDPLETWQQYGTIHDRNAKRRKTRVPPPAPPQAPTTAGARPLAKPAVVVSTTKPAPESQTRAAATKAAPAKTAPLRRDDSLFKSFAKTKPPKEEQASANASAAASEDEDMSEGPPAPAQAPRLHAKPKPKSEKELAAEQAIRDMMDEDVDADADVEMADSPAAEPEGEADGVALDAPPAVEQAQQATTSDGRVRGRRRVMKTRTLKDAEGYLVTKEEAVWESFSEDEPVPKRPKVEVKSAAPVKGKGSGAAATGGKPEKKGQGNIMSFFGKKG